MHVRTHTISRLAGSALVVALAFAAAALVAGCSTVRITTPNDFARLDTHGTAYRYRAVSAYGVAIAVRKVANPQRGNLDFWSEAIDRQLQRTGNYHPNGRVDVRTDSGLNGRRLAYTYGDAQAGQTYWVTVFVGRKTVYVLEAGGGIDAFTRARAGVEAAIRSFGGA